MLQVWIQNISTLWFLLVIFWHLKNVGKQVSVFSFKICFSNYKIQIYYQYIILKFNITKNCIQLRRLADEPINIQVFLKLSDMNCLGVQYYLVGKTSRYLYFRFWIWVLPYSIALHSIQGYFCPVLKCSPFLQTIANSFAQSWICPDTFVFKDW